MRTLFNNSLSISAAALLTTGLALAQQPPVGTVVINEVYYDAPSFDEGQVFVELYGTPGMDISGYSIRGIEGAGTSAGNCQGTSTDLFVFPASSTIPADGFVVVADGDSDGGTTSVANADYVDGDMDLENGADSVVLLDSTGAVIDACAYGAIDTSVTVSGCTGASWFEGNPTRDVFAPLSVERCPAGSDTGDNATDFVPNVPTPGTGEANCSAIEYVSLGAGDDPSNSAGNAVGFDFWFDSGYAGAPYWLIAGIVDPATYLPITVPGWEFLPLLDTTTVLFLNVAGAPGPFATWTGTLDGNGASIGTAKLDFAAAPTLPAWGATWQMYVGGISATGGISTFAGTNYTTINMVP